MTGRRICGRVAEALRFQRGNTKLRRPHDARPGKTCQQPEYSTVTPRLKGCRSFPSFRIHLAPWSGGRGRVPAGTESLLRRLAATRAAQIHRAKSKALTSLQTSLINLFNETRSSVHRTHKRTILHRTLEAARKNPLVGTVANSGK